MASVVEIKANSDVVTLINVFVVEPNNQETLFQTVKEGAETLMRKQPGYIAASVHKSRDGQRVIVYAQWRSPEDVQAFRSRPELREYFTRVSALAQFEPIVCDASYVHHI